ncbi:hydrolase [Pseudoalteromonas sp. SWXJ133]|uniref:hydrolase n=1 Tax=unclassified Pseudoalteromonas TaxID=194690 RepID=UPI00140C1C97|nr:hydrolase [Pseudoalteromonas sp. SWXJ133]
MVLSNIDVKNSILLIIDLQELLAPAIKDFPNVLKSTLQLAQAGIIHGVPILITEQYVKGLGETDHQIKNMLPDAAYFHKTHFSACAELGFIEQLKAYDKKQIIVVGTEAHVCVLQTCLDLVQSGFEVIIIQDAIGSRNLEHKKLAVEQLRQAGAVISCTEIVIFQWTKQAATPTFKKILPIIK